MLASVTAEMFRKEYADVFGGDERWRSLKVPGGNIRNIAMNAAFLAAEAKQPVGMMVD